MTLNAPAGSLYVISAPSGAGKTSLVQRLLADLPQVGVSVSHTTRPPRPGEIEGENYYFVSPQQFESLVAEDRFLEYARVFEHYYGTSRDTVCEQLANGEDIILEIDWQGARQVRKQFPDARGIFILPPSLEALDARLRARGQDDPTVIAYRMQSAVAEMHHYDEFDYLIINDDFATSLEALRSIIVANRQNLAAQTRRHSDLLTRMLS